MTTLCLRLQLAYLIVVSIVKAQSEENLAQNYKIILPLSNWFYSEQPDCELTKRFNHSFFRISPKCTVRSALKASQFNTFNNPVFQPKVAYDHSLYFKLSADFSLKSITRHRFHDDTKILVDFADTTILGVPLSAISSNFTSTSFVFGIPVASLPFDDNQPLTMAMYIYNPSFGEPSDGYTVLQAGEYVEIRDLQLYYFPQPDKFVFNSPDHSATTENEQKLIPSGEESDCKLLGSVHAVVLGRIRRHLISRREDGIKSQPTSASGSIDAAQQSNVDPELTNHGENCTEESCEWASARINSVPHVSSVDTAPLRLFCGVFTTESKHDTNIQARQLCEVLL